MKHKLIKGLILMVLGILFGWSETRFFGKNLWPQSVPEFLCDAITWIIVYVGYLLFTAGCNENAERIKNKYK